MDIAILVVALAAALTGFCWTGWILFQTRRRYGPLIDADTELARRKRETKALLDEQQGVKTSLAEARRRAEEDIKRERDAFNARYAAAKETYDKLQREVALLESSTEDMSAGIYKPQFDFKTSAEYKNKLEGIYERQKQLARQGAVHFGTNWTINGSQAEGARMQKQYAKLMLRGFNGECDAAIAKVAWNNVNGMIERIRKSLESFNTLGVVMNISLTPEYMNLRLEELRCAYELEEKRHAEQEEQRRIRAQMREEEKAQHEIELAKKKAEEDEARYTRALAEAQVRVAHVSGAELDKLNGKIGELQRQLVEAQQNKARAVSRAQMTKSGHLYIVSNIGSFGEGVYKIGMTRRLDPLERVQELNDASVPFGFDVHGMIFADDVPALEHAIHQHFQSSQINRVNSRKEFFRLSLDELGAFAKSRNLTLELTMLAEAKEYRQTMALLAQLAEQAAQATTQSPEPTGDFPHAVLQ
ncbi:MAG TPA: DUF4041 domain-containing protein [Rhizomicrobium sp.]|nr:DUF4041 domain-containing protein [Rhizomicrobium sp.]